MAQKLERNYEIHKCNRVCSRKVSEDTRKDQRGNIYPQKWKTDSGDRPSPTMGE